MELKNMNMNDMIIEKVKVVELTMEDGTKILRRGGEDAVRRAWETYPIVSARWTGEEEIMQWIPEEDGRRNIIGW
jgi:hypothetical protein